MENINAKTIKKGQRYISKVWLNPVDNSPMVCLVTKVASGTVYYRGDYGKHDDGTPWLGSAAHFPIEQASRWFSL